MYQAFTSHFGRTGSIAARAHCAGWAAFAVRGGHFFLNIDAAAGQLCGCCTSRQVVGDVRAA